MTHEVKIQSCYYRDVVKGNKRFELRKNDRGYKVGDLMLLCEYDDSGKATGSAALCQIVYVLQGCGFGLDPDYCILGFRLMTVNFVRDYDGATYMTQGSAVRESV